MAARKRIWIDTDIIFDRFGGDVDDGLALILALQHPGVHVAGISLIRDVAHAEQVTRKLLGYYARYPIPVHRGENDPSAGPGARTPAVEQLAAALREGELSIVSIGPATNLATLLERYPREAGNIREIVFCAGRRQGFSHRPKGSRLAFPDGNFERDPVSMQAVVESGVPVTLAGYQASAGIFLDAQDVRRIRDNGRDGDAWVAKQLRRWLRLWRYVLGLRGFIPFDAVTIGHVLYPEYFRYDRAIPVAVNTRANDARFFSLLQKQPSRQKACLEVSCDINASHTVDFVQGVEPAYKDRLMRGLLGG